MGLACVVMALTWSALTLTIGFAALRGATIGGLSLVSQHVINLWFVTRRGMAATAASVGVALGGVVFPQVIDALIRSGGWRRAYLTLVVMVAATMLAVGLLVFRDRPERFGLTPDLGVPRQRSRVTPEPAYTRAEALRIPVFWTISLANVLTNALGTGLLLNHFDLLLRGGVAREAAVIVFAPLSITQVAAAVGIGPLVDASCLTGCSSCRWPAWRSRAYSWLRSGPRPERSSTRSRWGLHTARSRRLTPPSTPTTSDGCTRGDPGRHVRHHDRWCRARISAVRLGVSEGQLFPGVGRWRGHVSARCSTELRDEGPHRG
jgi:MFS family permease